MSGKGSMYTLSLLFYKTVLSSSKSCGYMMCLMALGAGSIYVIEDSAAVRHDVSVRFQLILNDVKHSREMLQLD